MAAGVSQLVLTRSTPKGASVEASTTSPRPVSVTSEKNTDVATTSSAASPHALEVLAMVAAEVAGDSSDRPEQYLKATVVPFGGE